MVQDYVIVQPHKAIAVRRNLNSLESEVCHDVVVQENGVILRGAHAHNDTSSEVCGELGEEQAVSDYGLGAAWPSRVPRDWR